MKGTLHITEEGELSKYTIPMAKDMSQQALIDQMCVAMRYTDLFWALALAKENDTTLEQFLSGVTVRRDSDVIVLRLEIDDTPDLIDRLWDHEEQYLVGPDECHHESIESLVLTGYLCLCSCGSPAQTMLLLHRTMKQIREEEVIPTDHVWDGLMIYALKATGLMEKDAVKLTELGEEIFALADYEVATYE